MAYTTINKPSEYFNTKLYTGNGGTNAITGVGFQPDFVWLKSRSEASTDHKLLDAVRGVPNFLSSNLTAAEASTGSFNSIDSDGFTVDTTNAAYNQSSATYASWNWKANGAGSSNTDGSITSTVSANTTSGFSIVSYTGTGASATVGHGLGSSPKMVIVKKRDGASTWLTYNANIGNGYDYYLSLNSSAIANSADATVWNNTNPTSTVFSLGNWGDLNGNGSTYIAYCFAEKKGYSKFGSYTGLGGTNYPFIYTGFKPAFVMAKRTNDTSNWVMYDNKRQYNLIEGQYNPQRPRLASNLSNAESSFTTDNGVDLLSNGFVVRDNSNDAYTINISGSNYIYMAFAEQPLVTTGKVPATAR